MVQEWSNGQCVGQLASRPSIRWNTTLMDTLDARKQAMFCTTYPYYRHLVYMPGKLGAVSSVYVCVCMCVYAPTFLCTCDFLPLRSTCFLLPPISSCARSQIGWGRQIPASFPHSVGCTFSLRVMEDFCMQVDITRTHAPCKLK